MWMYIIGGVILFEILGGLFFYSLISVSHKADQQLGAIRRSRIMKRKATRFVRKHLATRKPIRSDAPQVPMGNTHPLSLIHI